MNTQPRLPNVDQAAILLAQHEHQAIKIITGARGAMLVFLTPMAMWLGTNRFDQYASLALIGIYFLVIGVSAWLIVNKRHLNAVALTGCVLDVIVISILPWIWYTTLGGSDLPIVITLKTSVTLMAILFLTLNALMMRPRYIIIVTLGALLLHTLLLVMAFMDERSVFTSNYLIAYSSVQVSIGRVVTQLAVLVMIGAILSLLTLRARKLIVEAVRLQKNNDQLGRYFSPNLVERLVENPALFQVGGERKDLSFVFTDLAGFTTLVESNDPAQVIPLLNGYLNEMVQIAFKHEGTVEKIVGDALHIIFGAPVTQHDHAEKAMACALELDFVADRYRKQYIHDIDIGMTRIGINSGFAIVGNFGSDAFFDYSAHGDAINTAARLESANKIIGTRVCVSGDTVARLKIFNGRPVGILWLKGKSNGIKVFAPDREDDSGPCSKEEYIAAYELLERSDANAVQRFMQLHERYPKDTLVTYHLNRLKRGETGVKIVLDRK